MFAVYFSLFTVTRFHSIQNSKKKIETRKQGVWWHRRFKIFTVQESNMLNDREIELINKNLKKNKSKGA